MAVELERMTHQFEAQPKSPSLVSIVVPALNEEQNISRCVNELSKAMGGAGYDSEIIVVNDGSTDSTLSIARSMRDQYDFLRVLDLKRHYGKATALREGIRAAKGDVVAFFDADMQYDASDLARMVGLKNNGTDVVTGSRDYRSYGQARAAISRTYNRILRLVFRVTLSDSNCGIKVLARGAADPDLLFKYGLPLMIPLLTAKGFRLRETAVPLRNRIAGKSKFFQDGSLLGGWENAKSIAFNSGMMLGLLASLAFQRLR